MLSIRAFLYGIIGFFLGLIISAVVLESVLPANTPGSIHLVGTGIGTIGGALLLGWLGRSMSRAEAQSEKDHGYFFVTNRMAFIFIICGIVLNVPAYYLLPKDLLQNFFVGLLLGIIVTIISCWASVSYVARKGYLQSKHDPARVALWFAGIWAVFFFLGTFILSEHLDTVTIIRLLVSIAILYYATYFFTKKAIASSVK